MLFIYSSLVSFVVKSLKNMHFEVINQGLDTKYWSFLSFDSFMRLPWNRQSRYFTVFMLYCILL